MLKIKKLPWTMILVVLLVFAFQTNIIAQYTFQQQDDEWGLVVMEAEHYTEMVLQGNDYFEEVLEPELFSGDGAMMAVGLGGAYATGDAALAGSPYLTYMIDFIYADSVYIWVRGSHESGGDDSYHAGLDGVITATSERIGYHGEPYGVWTWLGTNMDNVPPTLYVDSPGLHQFEVYIRENGCRHDKFVLTTSRDYIPDIIHGDMGPDETLTDVEQSAENMGPREFKLNQNYPNPFNPTTTISYQLTKNSDVLLTIYNQTGQKVRSLVQEKQGSGFQSINWDGRDDAGQQLSSSIYLYRLQVDNEVQTRKLMLMK